MKHRFEKRILSLILCLSMVFTLIITHANFAFSAEDEEDIPQINTENFENNVGKQAIFDWWDIFDLAPDVDSKPGEANRYNDDDLFVGERVFVITDYYYNDGEHWYKLASGDGMELPEILGKNPWVLYAYDIDFEVGTDPYLCIYEANETIRFVKDVDNYYSFVFAGPSELANTEIVVEESYNGLINSDLTNIATSAKLFNVTIDKATGDAVDLWNSNDGIVSIRYEAALLGLHDYYLCGAAFLYIDGKVFSATTTDIGGYDRIECSDVVYTNSGTSMMVFELMNDTFEYRGEKAYFVNDSVTLYNNQMQAGDFLAAQLPVTFTAEYSFWYKDVEYYWLEDKGFIGSPYFIAKADDVMLGELPEGYGDGRVSITDKMGNSVSEIVLPQYEKPEFTAISSLSQSTADVNYQWQICYDVDNYLWADIYGENNATIKISYGMVKTLLDENGQCAIRCESKTSTMTAYSKPIVITLEMYEPKEPDVVVSESFVTSNGETVTVSVAGDIPVDASVALEEIDSSGVEVNAGETVVASLDISIKNADGTEWQPESGESVTVNLPASSIGLMEGDDFVVYHLHNGEVRILGTYTVTDGTVSFEVDGFSKFVFALALDTEQFDECINKYATFNAWNDFTGEGSFDYFWLKADPSSETEEIYEWSIYDSDFSLDQVVQVKEYYIDSENSIWLRVEAVNGLELPTSLKEHPWVHMNSLDDYDASYDTLNLFVPQDTSDWDSVILDKYGLPIGNVYMYTNEKKTVTAQTKLTGSVKYQWQLCYDVDNYLWMDIYGQTSETLTLSYALLAGVLDEEGRGAVRCVTSNAVETVESFPIVVSVLESYVEETYWFYNVDGRMMYASTPDSAAGGISPIAETPNAVLVTVQFVMGNNTVPIENGLFTYNVPYNGSVANNIVIPTVQGYAAYLEDDRTTPVTGIYALNETNVTETKTITLRFWPAEVDYKVVYMQQNVEDDGYTIVRTDELKGLTGSDPVVDNPHYEGFMQVWCDTDVIAADGSTKIEVRYDRLYYKMLFDLDGGYGVQPVYARYGTPISVINPTKAGYSFVGWNAISGPYSDGDDTTADIIAFTNIEVPNENTNYKALWLATNSANVTVIVWGQNADNSDNINDPKSYSYMADASKDLSFNAKPGASVTYNPNGGYVCGYTEQHTHGQGNCEATCNKTEHTHSAVNGSCYTLSCKDTVHTAHTESCYTCRVTTHNHTIECYNERDIGDRRTPTTEIPSNPSEGYVFRHWWYQELIYIDGSWYEYSGSTSSGSIATTICGKTENTHTHTDACIGTTSSCPGIHTHIDSCYTLTCITAVHSHNAACYSGCTKDEHTHISECSLTVSGMSSSLWTFHHADTVTVSADGTTTLNVYYIRTKKTLTFKYDHRNNKYNKTETIEARWGQNISAQYIKIAENAKSTFWSATESGGQPYTNYFGIMPQTSATYYNRGVTGSTGEMKYYGQKVDGSGYDLMFTVTGVGGYRVTDEDRYAFDGFEYERGTANQQYCSGATFYYTRKSYKLVFNNYGSITNGNGNGENVIFGKSLANYATYKLNDDQAPDIYQDGSVTFKGWYLAPQTPNDFNFENATPFDFANSTMPSSDFILYAWWQPVKHNVTFYYDYEAMQSDTIYTEDGVEKRFEVPHGSKVQDPYIPPKDPTSNYYSFVGWAYRDDNGTEILWDFANATVTEDIKLYGKWNSTTAAEYEVRFVTVKNGVEVDIAEPISGSALGGTSKTFNAKYNEDLYTGYQDRYYPHTPSHNITINLEDLSKNTFTFYYEYVEFTSYTVKYLEKDTGKPMSEINSSYPSQKTVENNTHAMVTEIFVPIAGYLPDAYHKTCMIDPDGNNEIIFYYTKDNENGLWTVHFYLENLDGTYTEALDMLFTGTAENGANVTAPTDKVIPNYYYYAEHAGNVSSGTVSINEVTHLHMYYNRTVHSYTVNYLEAGTNNVLATQKVLNNIKWGTPITEYAIDINNYQVYGLSEQSFEISINDTMNVINFYYTEKRVNVNYVAVGPEGATNFGTVTPDSESLAIITGTASGSVATPSSNLYKFVGWYSNAACTEEVGKNATFVPTKNATDFWEGTTYYAKFEYNLTSLTIKKEGWEDIDPNQTFIFNVKGDDGVNLDVTVHGNGSVTIDGLTVGETYTVTEKTDWSWRYTNNGVVNEEDATTVTITDTAVANGAEFTLNPTGNVITFTNTRSQNQWLDGDSWCNNIFDFSVNQTK